MSGAKALRSCLFPSQFKCVEDQPFRVDGKPMQAAQRKAKMSAIVLACDKATSDWIDQVLQLH
eukprot:scaffold156900_cov15-Tisochrysis_lutea.AAC.1